MGITIESYRVLQFASHMSLNVLSKRNHLNCAEKTNICDILWTASSHMVHTHQEVKNLIQKLFIPTYTNHGLHEPASTLSGDTHTYFKQSRMFQYQVNMCFPFGIKKKKNKNTKIIKVLLLICWVSSSCHYRSHVSAPKRRHARQQASVKHVSLHVHMQYALQS